MNELLVQKELNENVTYTEFTEDTDCLFHCLEELYGMYDYFGKDQFEKAHRKVKNLPAESFTLQQGIGELRKSLSFIKDGHFHIGKAKPYVKQYPYAVRYTSFHGIPMIDCKKFWADDAEEERQLEEFAGKGADYRAEKKLILDFRGNAGGSSVYIYDFLEGLTGREVGFSGRFLQRWSDLYSEYLLEKGEDYQPEQVNEWVEEKVDRIPNDITIYVLFDEQSASAAEEGIAILRNMDNVVLVGDHSAGMGSCGNCLPIYLPHSHIEVYFGTGILLYEGFGNMDAGGGFKGDISFEDFEKQLENS